MMVEVEIDDVEKGHDVEDVDVEEWQNRKKFRKPKS